MLYNKVQDHEEFFLVFCCANKLFFFCVISYCSSFWCLLKWMKLHWCHGKANRPGWFGFYFGFTLMEGFTHSALVTLSFTLLTLLYNLHVLTADLVLSVVNIMIEKDLANQLVISLQGNVSFTEFVKNSTHLETL